MAAAVIALLLLACAGEPDADPVAAGPSVAAGSEPEGADPASVAADVPPAVSANPPCDAAWAEIAAVRDAMAPLSPDLKAPDQDRFLAACRALPADVQPCLSMRVLVDDPACRARIDGLPRATRESLEAALAPAAALDDTPPPH